MDVKTVAIVGAGVSGVSSAIHLKNAGLEVTVFERGDVAGGVWYVLLSYIVSVLFSHFPIQSCS